LRKALVAMVLAFAVTLAAIIGTRMSAEAMAVVVGVVCGVAAGIPVSLLILLISNRRGRQAEEATHYPGGRYGAYPPVVVIQGGTPSQDRLAPPYYPAGTTAYEPAQRQFRLVGDYEER